MSTQDTTLPPLPEPFGLFCGVRLTPPQTTEFWGMLTTRETGGEKCNLYTENQMQAYARAAIAAQAQQPATVKDSLTTQQAQQAQGVPVGMVKAMKDAIEGECDGLAITDAHAKAILQYVLAAAPQAEPQTPAPVAEPSEERRQLLHLLDDIVEEAEQDGATYYRIRDGKDILFSNMVGACARLLAQPEAPAVSAEPQPEREPFTADVECVTDESGTDYSVAVRGPGIRNPLYSDVWLKSKNQAAMLAKWLNESVFPTMAGTKGGDTK